MSGGVAEKGSATGAGGTVCKDACCTAFVFEPGWLSSSVFDAVVFCVARLVSIPRVLAVWSPTYSQPVKARHTSKKNAIRNIVGVSDKCRVLQLLVSGKALAAGNLRCLYARYPQRAPGGSLWSETSWFAVQRGSQRFSTDLWYHGVVHCVKVECVSAALIERKNTPTIAKTTSCVFSPFIRESAAIRHCCMVRMVDFRSLPFGIRQLVGMQTSEV